MEETPIVERPLAKSSPPSPSPPPTVPKFDLWMLAALGCLPLAVVAFCSLNFPWQGRATMLLFVTGVGMHCLVQQGRGRSLAWRTLTSAWLLPSIVIIGFVIEQGPPRTFEEFFCVSVGFSLYGLVSGFVTVKLIEAVFVLRAVWRRRMRGGKTQTVVSRSIRERLDDDTTPLEAPPTFGLPRRFGVRGLLVATTWAALLMGLMRACGASGSVYFMVMTFVAGVLAAQVLLFRGRNPLMASAWCGAFLLPAQTLALNLYWNWQWIFSRADESVMLSAASLAGLVPAGIFLGGVVGAIGGGLYLVGDNFFVWNFRGVPNIALEPITDADADVLLSWITGPKLFHRWAGEKLTWPLDRQQLLNRFAAARDRTVRKIYKSVDVRSGEMVGYLELGQIDYSGRRAWIEMPLVDTNASERGRLSVKLLRAAAVHAFRQIKLVALTVSAETVRGDVARCCDKAWFEYFYYYPFTERVGRQNTVYRDWQSWNAFRAENNDSLAPKTRGDETSVI